jgi:hypothetical protein
MLKTKIRKVISAMTTIVGLLSVALIPPSTTVLGAPLKQDGSENAPVHSPKTNTEAEAEAVKDYWTPDKMAQAQPMPMPSLSSDLKTSIQPAPAEELGAPGLVDGGAPGQ